jgi:hypothetical protein
VAASRYDRLWGNGWDMGKPLLIPASPVSPAPARLAGFIVFLKELNAVSFFFDNLFDSLKGSKN